jgi:hypothetical protein
MNPRMKSSSLLFLLLLPLGLLSCDKKGARLPTVAAKPEEKEVPTLSKFQSREVLPGSRDNFSRPNRPQDTPKSLAHDTPSMDKKARGSYSYLGAAREFKAICGFNLPDWVEPLKGGFSVFHSGGGFVRQSTLEYKIDPARRAELEKLIAEANAREFPQRAPVIFHSTSGPAVSSGAHIDFKPDGKVKESMAVRIDEEGIVTLRASLGPVGWDD